MTISETIYCAIIVFFIVLIIISGVYSGKARIVPAPTLPWVRKVMIDAVRKHLGKSDAAIAELGSGWGALVFALARLYPAGRIAGYEISPFPYAFSKLRHMFGGKNVTLRPENFFDADLRGFDAIICYLSPHHMADLKPKFEQELKPGAVVISNAFAIPGWQPVETLYSNFLIKIPVYVYRK